MLNVLTHNLFGKEDGCEIRLYRAGLQIRNSRPEYDIIGLNEYNDNTNAVFEDIETTYLGCDGVHLKDALYDPDSFHFGKYPDNSRHRRTHYPVGEPWQFDYWWGPLCYPAPELDGGVGILTNSGYPIVDFHEHEWMSDVNYVNRRVHGFIFSRVQLRATPALYVDVYVAHIYAESDGCDRACRRAAMVQMRDKMKEYSGSTPWPVILMGDFNISGPPLLGPGVPEGWSDIVQVFGAPRDVWLEPKPHPISELGDGATYDCANNPIANCDSPSKRIDFIFVLENIPFVRGLGGQPKYKIARVREQDRGVYDGRLSDHYGVWAHLQVLERTQQLCTSEEAALAAAQRALGEANLPISGMKATLGRLYADGQGDSRHAEILEARLAAAEAALVPLVAAVRGAQAAYDQCLGDDIVIDTDYNDNPPACQDELDELRSTDMLADQQGVHFQLLLDAPATRTAGAAELDLANAALVSAKGERSLAVQDFEDCMAAEIAANPGALVHDLEGTLEAVPQPKVESAPGTVRGSTPRAVNQLSSVPRARTSQANR